MGCAGSGSGAGEAGAIGANSKMHVSDSIACPYEGMNITGASGLTEAQKVTLRGLGASEE